MNINIEKELQNKLEPQTIKVKSLSLNLGNFELSPELSKEEKDKFLLEYAFAVIDNQSHKMLAIWWCILNTWNWVDELGIEESYSETRSYIPIINSNRMIIMNYIKNKIGKQLVNRVWNNDMTDKQFKIWWDYRQNPINQEIWSLYEKEVYNFTRYKVSYQELYKKQKKLESLKKKA
jgi:hypothetical protein